MVHSRIWIGLCLLGLLLSSAGCGAAGQPRLIAVQPLATPAVSSGWNPPAPPFPPVQVVYHTDLTLEVSSSERAAEHILATVEEAGGFLVRWEAYQVAGREHQALTLQVPATEYQKVHRSLVKLGSVQQERSWGELINYTEAGAPAFAEFRLYLQPLREPREQVFLRWRPVRTFLQAGEVFLSIAGFLLDIAIWLLVVGGPFVLLGWGLWLAYRRWRRSGHGNSPD